MDSFIKLLCEKFIFFLVIYEQSNFFVSYKWCELMFDPNQECFIGLKLYESTYHRYQFYPFLRLLFCLLHCQVFFKPNLNFHAQKSKYGLVNLRKMLLLFLFALLAGLVTIFLIIVHILNLQQACDFSLLPMLSHANCQGVFPANHVLVNLYDAWKSN